MQLLNSKLRVRFSCRYRSGVQVGKLEVFYELHGSNIAAHHRALRHGLPRCAAGAAANRLQQGLHEGQHVVAREVAPEVAPGPGARRLADVPAGWLLQGLAGPLDPCPRRILSFVFCCCRDGLPRLFDSAEERQLLLNLLLHCADISNPGGCWAVPLRGLGGQFVLACMMGSFSWWA